MRWLLLIPLSPMVAPMIGMTGCTHLEVGPSNESRIEESMRFETYTEATPGAQGIAFSEKSPEPIPDWDWQRYLPRAWGFGGRAVGHPTRGAKPFTLGPTLATGGRHF